MNERGQITQASLQGTPCTWSYGTDGILDEVDAGSVHNYEYDFDVYTGNLDYRKNALENLQEDFTYDNLDRLDEVYGPIDYQVMYYESNGNIDVKSDAGDFEYNYPTRPFQISDIDGYQDIVDTTRQDIDYTSFSKIETITQAAYEATFKYNSDNQRVKMVLENNGSVSKTKYYFGSSYEKVVEGSTTTEYIWIGGSPYDAVAVAEITNGGTPEIYSVYRDHLGTMTHIKSSSTTNKYSFDACSVKLSFCELCETKALVELIPISEAVREGRRRDADTWNYTLTGEPGLFADRGFTGHEHMPEFGLINMNGRVYDPVLGRFLSPDNYVQAPDYSQGFNRYSYCLNNPLSFTDYSGEEFTGWHLAAGMVFGPVSWMGIYKHAQGDYSVGQAIGSYFVSSAAVLTGAWIGGVVAGAVGSVGFIGGATSAAAGGYASGFIGGAGNSWINGDSFFEGLNKGLIGANVGAVSSGVIGGISGGITASTRGGNFWTGKGTIFEYVASVGLNPENVKVGEGMEYSAEYATSIADKTFGKLNYVEKIATNQVPTGKEFSINNGCIIDKKGSMTNGLTEYLGKGRSKVYLGKSAFTSANQLKLTIGHEYIHATHFNMGYPRGSIFKDINAQYKGVAWTEISAYNWVSTKGVSNGYEVWSGRLGAWSWSRKPFFNWLLNANF